MLKVNKLIDRFKMNVLNKDVADLNREINSPAIHRLGLELLGAAEISKHNFNVIGWGTKESKFMLEHSPAEQRNILMRVLSTKTPLIILSNGVDDKVVKLILEVCNEFKIPLVKNGGHLSNVIMTVGWYIVKYLAESVDVHGSLVIVNGVGVMIIGESGIGKSEAVLELIQGGSSFVSDDTVILKKIGTDFIGEAAPLTKDFLESRGIGLINISKIYGLKAIKDYVNVELVVELLPSAELNNVDRLGNSELKYEALNGYISKIQIPVNNGRNPSALIEAAVNVYLAKKNGDNPLEVIAKRRDV